MGGFRAAAEAMLGLAASASLLTRERFSPLYFFSYTFIPLSVDRLPAHHDLLPDRAAHGAVQEDRDLLPALHHGDLAALRVPGRDGEPRAATCRQIQAKLEARAHAGARRAADAGARGSATRCARRRRATTCCCCCSSTTRPLWLAGLLGAGIMAAVMASDSQILALSTMFTEDVFAHYGGKARFGEAAQVQTGARVRGRC